MSAKTILVTGANRGIGLEVCKQLGAIGHRVILTARSPEKGEAAAREAGAGFQELDVTDKRSREKLFQFLKENHGQLDVLINNAGILLDETSPLLSAGSELVEATIRTNALAPFYLTQTLLPLMKKGSHIIMVSSGAGEMCGTFGSYAPVYSASKTLMNAFSRHLATALRPKGIRVNAVCPGWVRTGMGGSVAPRSVEKGAETIVWLAQDRADSDTGNFYRDKQSIHW